MGLTDWQCHILTPGGRERAWGGICTYSGGKELIKVVLFNPAFSYALLQTVFLAQPTTGKDLSFSATCLSLCHTPVSFNTLVSTACHFSRHVLHSAFRLEVFEFQPGGQHASSMSS